MKNPSNFLLAIGLSVMQTYSPCVDQMVRLWLRSAHEVLNLRKLSVLQQKTGNNGKIDTRPAFDRSLRDMRCSQQICALVNLEQWSHTLQNLRISN